MHPTGSSSGGRAIDDTLQSKLTRRLDQHRAQLVICVVRRSSDLLRSYLSEAAHTGTSTACAWLMLLLEKTHTRGFQPSENED